MSDHDRSTPRSADHRPDAPDDPAWLAPGDKEPVDLVAADTPDPYVVAEDRSDDRGPRPEADRWHGAVRDPDHPEFHDRDDRVPPPEEPAVEAARALVEDDLTERRSRGAAVEHGDAPRHRPDGDPAV